MTNQLFSRGFWGSGCSALDRAFGKLADQCMTMLEDTEEYVQDDDCPFNEGYYNKNANIMRRDRDEVILIRMD